METLEKYGINFMDLKKLAEVKSISVFTLRKYARNEGMPHHRVGRKILVDPITFDKWFLSRNIIATDDNQAKSVEDILDDVLHEIA